MLGGNIENPHFAKRRRMAQFHRRVPSSCWHMARSAVGVQISPNASFDRLLLVARVGEPWQTIGTKRELVLEQSHPFERNELVFLMPMVGTLVGISTVELRSLQPERVVRSTTMANHALGSARIMPILQPRASRNIRIEDRIGDIGARSIHQLSIRPILIPAV